MRRFEDKVAIITGSSRGIGRTIALYLGKEGAKIVLNGRNEDQLSITKDLLLGHGIDVASVSGDVSNPEDCKKIVNYASEIFGRVDILINNAGIGSRGFFENTTPEVFRSVIDVNILGSVYPTLEALPLLKASKGSLLFISSLAGLRGLPNRAPYSMTKMAITAMAEALNVEMREFGVHIGIVYAGATSNDPDKFVINSDGTWSKLQLRKGIGIHTQDEIAKTVLSAIQKRKYKTITGFSGKVYYTILRFFPGLPDFVFRKSKYFIQRHDD